MQGKKLKTHPASRAPLIDKRGSACRVLKIQKRFKERDFQKI